MKKIISVLLVVSMLIVVLAPAAFAAKVTRVSTPVIFVGGQEDYIYSDKNDAESDTYLTGDLPKEALQYVRYLESAVGCRIKYVSVGPDRDAYIKLF